MKYIICLVLTTLSVSSAKGACLDWSRNVGRPDHSLVYAGKLGNHPIRMMLHLDVATGHFEGAYGYNDQPGTLALSGSMRPGGVGADLDERDAQGRVTGHFSLGFLHLRRPEDSRTYDKYSDKCDTLTGGWQSSSGKETRDVAVRVDGEIDPAQDKERQMNDITAYKLRKAMLDKNKQSFASLLRYPFYTNGFYRTGGVIHLTREVWNYPENIIKNYDKMINYQRMEPFSYEQVRDAVPHFLTPAGSVFMNGSVFIEHGKVTRICAGSCPVDPND